MSRSGGAVTIGDFQADVDGSYRGFTCIQKVKHKS